MPATVSHTTQSFPFGEEMAAQHAGGAYSTRYKFNGKELDPQTGYYYYGARYYDPVVSRWLSIDPLAEKYPGFSAYNYTLNNPIMLVDPFGLWPIYSKDGKYLGDDGKYEKGKDYVFIGEAVYDDNGNITGYKNLQKLSVTHTEFQIISQVIKKESSGDKLESLWIAHAANNWAKKTKKTLYKLLTSGYSSVKDKSPLSTSDNSNSAINARHAVIDVFTGGTDPTGGADHWDGVDFILLGSRHAKFFQYKTITIHASVYYHYLTGIVKYYNKTLAKHGGIKYGGKYRNFPAPVFVNSNNWKGLFFQVVTGASIRTPNLIATGAQGATIFWKTQ